MASGGQDPEGKGRRRPLPRWVTGIATLFDWSGRCIAVLCLGFMFVALLLNVVLRYAFGSGIAWAYEIHSLLLPWLVGGGIVIAAARGRNIAVTLLPVALSHRHRLWLLLVVHVVILTISLSVLWTSQPILKASQFQTLSTLGIKQIWGYSSLIYAFSGMAVIALIEILRLVFGDDSRAPDRTHASLS